MLTADSERRAPTPWRSARRIPSPGILARLGVSVVAGLALYATFPPLGLWWLGPAAAAALLAALHGVRLRTGLACGAVFALAYQWPLLGWTGEYVGGVWLLLLVFLVVVVAVTAGATGLVGRLPGGPLWQACVWVAGEALIERWPFAGFPWAKVAFGQPGGVFAPLAALGGAPLVSFAVVLTGAGLAAVARAVTRRRVSGRAMVGLGLAVLVGPLAGIATLPSTRAAPPSVTITVAAVQGNVPRAGLDFAAQRRAVLDNHVTQTLLLADAVRSGNRPRPDLVIWPENSSDVDPFRNADAGARIQQAADAVGVPIVVGAVQSGTRASDGRILQGPRNTAIVWLPGAGPAAQYTKRHLLPFGEYIPARGIARLVSPLVGRVTDFEPGTGSGVLPTGPARLGVVTCYEVVFDDSVRDAVRGGADLLAVPTNNATFGFTDMTYQQQAMSRLRAIEHDRAVVVAATSGQSAVIDPDGEIRARTGALFTPGVLVESVPLRTTTTVATRVGALPEWLLTALGVAALGVVAAGWARRRGDGRTVGRGSA